MQLDADLLTPDRAGFLRVVTRKEAEGARLPAGFAVAWTDYPQDAYVLLPVGVHLLVAGVRRGWHWLRAAARPSVLDTTYRLGCATSQDAAYVTGWNAALVALVTEVRPRAPGSRLHLAAHGLRRR